MPPKAAGANPAGAKPVPGTPGETSAPLDETAVRQSAVVSATFANVELQTTRQTLKQYVQLFEESRDENQRLTSELTERDKDSMKVVQFLRAELDTKLADMIQVQQQHKAAVDKIRADFHVERKQLLGEINEREDEISALQNQLGVLKGDFDALQQFATDRDQLHEEMTSFREQHKRECEAYEKEISRLRFTSLEEKVRVKAEERIMTEKFEAEVSDRAMKLLDAKTKEIHNENFSLLEDKVMLEHELDRLVKKKVEAYEKEISRLRFTSLEEKVRVKAEERIMTEKFEAEVSDRAMKLLDAKTKEIHNENFALLEDKVMLEHELDRLVAENKRMKEMTGSQKREVELAKVADDEYAKRGARQSREIKDLRQQCKLMEANIAKLIDEYEHKLEVQTHKFQTEMDKMREERDLSYRNAENRHKELIRMRQLSKHIVRQRSELEMFFNEALEYVRHQIVLERQQSIQDKFAHPPPQRSIMTSSDQPRLLISDQGHRGGQPPLPPQHQQQQGGQQQQPSSEGGNRPLTDQQRGNSALIASHHPFFQGSGKEFDSIYHAADEGGGLPSHRSSAQLPRAPSSNNSSTMLPAIQSRAALPSIPPTNNASVKGGMVTGAVASSSTVVKRAPPGSSSDALAGSTDIAHLAWVDKERVLRILLAKINNAARFERRDHTDLTSSNGKQQQTIMQVVAPTVPKQITTVSDTFLTQSTE
ncbi:Hypothetical protein, putative [Bodo saltans]|uniref:Basal body-orientation factor 1 n=1 Tax=Bodo saltans TaxID=75058 RepID=A0A0S4ILE6_BODSA|nr:Hypothetical protein, putative [Bodo saltans]|eukprot:CUE70451.1 Hypothetical protein, putative [Bodo saltans]